MSKPIQQMFTNIAHRYDLANDVLSFGMHRLWRRQAVAFSGVAQGSSVLDLCCGTGELARCLARAVGKRGSVVGLDFVPEMIELAIEKEQRDPSSADVRFLVGDALKIPFPDESFSLCTIAFGIRNVDDVSVCLREMRRVLTPGGTAMVLEFGQPHLPGLKQVFSLFSRFVMPLIGRLVTGDNDAYHYLPKSSSTFACDEKFLALMEGSEFINCAKRSLCGGIAYLYRGSKI